MRDFKTFSYINTQKHPLILKKIELFPITQRTVPRVKFSLPLRIMNNSIKYIRIDISFNVLNDIKIFLNLLYSEVR